MMIVVIETQDGTGDFSKSTAKFWVTRSRPEFFNACQLKAKTSGKVIFSTTSATAIATAFGQPLDTCRHADLAWLADLADKYGPATALYRADYLHPEGLYSPTPIDEMSAYVAYLNHDVWTAKVYTTGEALRAALDAGAVPEEVKTGVMNYLGIAESQ